MKREVFYHYHYAAGHREGGKRTGWGRGEEAVFLILMWANVCVRPHRTTRYQYMSLFHQSS